MSSHAPVEHADLATVTTTKTPSLMAVAHGHATNVITVITTTHGPTTASTIGAVVPRTGRLISVIVIRTPKTAGATTDQIPIAA